MKIGMEKLWGLRYKLRIMDIPLSGQSLIYIYNMSVIKIHKELSLHCIRKEIQYVKMQSKGHLQWENHWQHGCLQVQILLICWLKFYMGQSGDILWGMYCVISTMSIRNWIQDSGDLVVICTVMHCFARCNLRQYWGDYKLVAVNLDKYCKYVGRDEKSTEGYRNTKLVLELQSGLMKEFIEDAKGCSEP